ncbi:hypothetical protein Ct61P_15514 [Colletotrichum tofieldiae]|nr:hypothetical protein Ct61P_15514 [Colletotrichum tofieldiae]
MLQMAPIPSVPLLLEVPVGCGLIEWLMRPDKINEHKQANETRNTAGSNMPRIEAELKQAKQARATHAREVRAANRAASSTEVEAHQV